MGTSLLDSKRVHAGAFKAHLLLQSYRLTSPTEVQSGDQSPRALASAAHSLGDVGRAAAPLLPLVGGRASSNSRTVRMPHPQHLHGRCQFPGMHACQYSCCYGKCMTFLSSGLPHCPQTT